MRKLLTVIVITLSLWTVAQAAVPHLLNYQGRLADAAGAPLNGNYAINFKIYDAATAGTLLWEETQSSVVVQKGIFNILLGSVTALTLAFDKPCYLEIKVGNEVMSPRQQITSAGYAIKAETTEKIDGITAGGDLTGTYPNPSLKTGSMWHHNSGGQIVITAPGPSAWITLDLSSIVGKNYALVLLKFYCPSDISGGVIWYVRPYGDTLAWDSWYSTTAQGHAGYGANAGWADTSRWVLLVTETDAQGRVEYKSNWSGGNAASVTLMGFVR